MPQADFLAHDDGGGGCQTEADHGGQLVHVADEGVSGQHVLTVVHVAHDDGEHGGPQAPHGLVAHHRRGVADEPPQDILSRQQDAPQAQRQALAAESEGQRHNEFHNPAGQGGRRCAGNAHSRGAEVSENQHEVQKCVDAHGDAEQNHPKGGILGTALNAGVNAADAVKDIGEAHQPDIIHRQLYQLLIGCDKPQYLGGKQERNQRNQGGKPCSRVQGNTQTAVDILGVPSAPVLADQYGHAALEAEKHHLNNEHRHVGGGDRRHFRIPQQPDHEDVGEAQGSSDDILQDDRRGQRRQILIESFLLP